MFRLAPIVLLATSLSSVVIAQAADLAVQKNPTKQDAPANGSAPSENGTNQNGNGAIDADAAAAASAPKPLPFVGSAYLELTLDEKYMHAFVHGAEEGFVGVLGLSLTPDLAHSFTGLPPILVDAVVVAYGFTKTQDLELSVPLFSLPAEGTLVYGQAVVLDERGISVSGLVPLMIGQAGGNAPNNGSPSKGSPSNANLVAPAAH